MSSKKTKKAHTIGVLGRSAKLVKPTSSGRGPFSVLVVGEEPGSLKTQLIDTKTGAVLKSLTIAKPLLPFKEKARKKTRANSSKKSSVNGQHIARAATVSEMRSQLGIKGKDVVRAQQLVLRLKS